MNSLNNLKILCVEDEKFALDEMVYYLKKRAGKVYGACDGREGLEQAKLYKPDVVIADLLMPRMDGMMMIKKLRQIYDDIHVIIVTSVDSVDKVLEAANLGIDGYIIKPLDFAELEVKLEKIAGSIRILEGRITGRLDLLEDRRTAEDRIKKGFLRIVKDFTGKGPREAVVQAIGNEIKITSFGALTVMEENLAASTKNLELVKQTRNTVYEAIAANLEEAIAKEIGIAVSYNKADLDVRKQIEQLYFTCRK